MAKIIKQCECGSTEFLVEEKIVHSAEVDEEGILTCIGGCDEGEITGIFCRDCEKQYPEENFNQINF